MYMIQRIGNLLSEPITTIDKELGTLHYISFLRVAMKSMARKFPFSSAYTSDQEKTIG